MPLESPTYEQQLLMYGKQLKKGRGRRAVEKEAKPSIMADLSRAVSHHGVDLWLDAFCLRGHVGDMTVKKAVEAVLRTKLKQKVRSKARVTSYEADAAWSPSFVVYGSDALCGCTADEPAQNGRTRLLGHAG
ncbi:unnamed protein product [Ectocarpus sp. CCAP 1310/34]|nr:unnamed protein product [Ectocarpus sp. CCAP 1310/34]